MADGFLGEASQHFLSLPQNYFQKLEKLAATEEVHGDGPKKERTKLITPQVAKLEHTYKPGKALQQPQGSCYPGIEGAHPSAPLLPPSCSAV